MKTILVSILLICTLQGCINKKTGAFYLKPNSQVDISYQKLALDSIPLDTVTTSFVVNSSICDGNICVMDNYACTMYRFFVDGKFKDKKLGPGRAKDETTIGMCAAHCFLPDGRLVLYDYNGGYYIYSKDFLFENYFRVKYEGGGNDGNQDIDTLYKDPYSYTPAYNDNVCRSYGDCIYFKIQMAYPDYNYVNTTTKHLQMGGNILETNLKTKELTRLLAIGYPESYKENSNTKAIFSTVNYDISKNGDFYVTYEADTLIYQYDKDYHEKKCFGYAGKDMDLDYTSINTTADSRKYWRSERQTKGYYNWLEYVDETGMLFRSYQKGGNNSTDGLQIYKDGVLIGDVSVPKGFKVMGYVAPYYYSYVIADEKRELMYLYRFKL